jgi:ribosomal protein S18 acetylase RimI-like enzyme
MITSAEMVGSLISIVPYTPEHQPWFEKFNRDWIEKYFFMEPLDYKMLQHPDSEIIEKGGRIFMATYENEMAGTVALKRVGPAVFELTKMAVDEKFQGKKIGRSLAMAALAEAKQAGAKKIFLYSNTKLLPAIALYRKLGFREVPLDGPYKRTDIKMELILK